MKRYKNVEINMESAKEAYTDFIATGRKGKCAVGQDCDILKGQPMCNQVFPNIYKNLPKHCPLFCPCRLKYYTNSKKTQDEITKNIIQAYKTLRRWAK